MTACDVSDFEISWKGRQTSLKRWSNRERPSREAIFPGPREEGSSCATQRTKVALEGIVFLAPLTAIWFLGAIPRIPGDGARTARWDLTWGKDGLEPDERWADRDHRQPGGRPITGEVPRGDARPAPWRLASWHHVGRLGRDRRSPASGPGSANSEIINARCAECQFRHFRWRR
jgi:hypothetical protein